MRAVIYVKKFKTTVKTVKLLNIIECNDLIETIFSQNHIHKTFASYYPTIIGMNPNRSYKRLRALDHYLSSKL